MEKFIQNELNILKDLKTGIHDNTARWTGQPIAEIDIDTAITKVQAASDAIAAARAVLHEAITDGHAVISDQTKVSDQAANLARGIHAADPEKLIEYGIKERKVSEKIPAPDMAAIDSVKDDHDGIGFVITLKPLPRATTFNIDRAVTPADVLIADPKIFVHLKTTQKLSYVDDDVTPGMRYHYRITGFNRTGAGPVSAPVSAVQ